MGAQITSLTTRCEIFIDLMKTFLVVGILLLES